MDRNRYSKRNIEEDKEDLPPFPGVLLNSEEDKLPLTNPQLNNAILMKTDEFDEENEIKRKKSNYKKLRNSAKINSFHAFESENKLSHYRNPRLSIQSQRRVNVGLGFVVDKRRQQPQIRSILKKTLSNASDFKSFH